MAVVSALLLVGTLSTRGIIQTQSDKGIWLIFAAPVGFFIYLVASIAETNRAPFDMPEAESELVAGYMTEYSGFRWALYFLAEYTNMIVVSAIATTLFLGGWLRPFAGTPLFNFLDFFPTLLMFLIALYCFYRAPKQPVNVQKGFMVVVGLLCGGLGLLLVASVSRLRLPGGLMASAKRVWLHGAFWFLGEGFDLYLRVHAGVSAVYVSALPSLTSWMRLGWQFLWFRCRWLMLWGIAVGLVLYLASWAGARRSRWDSPLC